MSVWQWVIHCEDLGGSRRGGYRRVTEGTRTSSHFVSLSPQASCSLIFVYFLFFLKVHFSFIVQSVQLFVGPSRDLHQSFGNTRWRPTCPEKEKVFFSFFFCFVFLFFKVEIFVKAGTNFFECSEVSICQFSAGRRNIKGKLALWAFYSISHKLKTGWMCWGYNMWAQTSKNGKIPTALQLLLLTGKHFIWIIFSFP